MTESVLNEKFEVLAAELVSAKVPYHEAEAALRRALANGYLRLHNDNHGAASRDMQVHRNSVWRFKKAKPRKRRAK